MDSAALMEKAIGEGLGSGAWLLLLASVVAAGIGAFVGSYLKRKGEDLALQENFSRLLRELEAQTKVTEAIKHEFALELERIKAVLGQDVFVRELYAAGIREYASDQAHALRQAYLLLYEPRSSAHESAGNDTEERLEAAIQLVMQPLRKHIGLLDEPTIARIQGVQHRLQALQASSPEEFRKQKNEVFNATDAARQFVKADQIAARLGLIRSSLGAKEDGR